MRLNITKARKLAKQVVESRGRDFVYQTKPGTACTYRKQPELPKEDPRAQTGCIVGEVLKLAGDTRPRRAKHDNDGVLELQKKYPDMMTEATSRYLDRLQQYQDAGSSWGVALDAAENYLLARAENVK